MHVSFLESEGQTFVKMDFQDINWDFYFSLIFNPPVCYSQTLSLHGEELKSFYFPSQKALCT